MKTTGIQYNFSSNHEDAVGGIIKLFDSFNSTDRITLDVRAIVIVIY